MKPEKARCGLCGGWLPKQNLIEVDPGEWECRSLEQCCIRSRKRRAAQPPAFEEEYTE